MRLEADDPADVYFAFRLAFSDLPEVRVRTEHWEGPRRYGPGARFVAPSQPVRVFLVDERHEHTAEGTGLDWRLAEVEVFMDGDLHGVLAGLEPLKRWALDARLAWTGFGHPDRLTRELLHVPGVYRIAG